MENNRTSVEPNEKPQLIERIPDNILSPEQRRHFGGAAISAETVSLDSSPIPREGGRFNSGIVPVEPGPTGIRQARDNGSLPKHIIVRS